MGHLVDLARFQSKYVARPNGCWEWIAGKKGNGYGAFYLHGSLRGAHRVSLFLHKALPLDTPLDAMHSCDNPSCVNPEHLSYGTRTENMRDASRKGRIVHVQDWSATKNPRAKLTTEQRQSLEIAIQAGETTRDLSERFGITMCRVQQIARDVKKRAKKNGDGWVAEEF